MKHKVVFITSLFSLFVVPCAFAAVTGVAIPDDAPALSTSVANDENWECDDAFLGYESSLFGEHSECWGNQANWGCYGKWRRTCKETISGQTKTYSERRFVKCSTSMFCE